MDPRVRERQEKIYALTDITRAHRECYEPSQPLARESTLAFFGNATLSALPLPPPRPLCPPRDFSL
jgi:hypothetical protein